jgi:hypothetical protein
VAECRTEWITDDAGRTRIWELFEQAPQPVGYDPAIILGWTSPTDESFAVLRLEPWRLRVFPGEGLRKAEREVLTWTQ